jgi:hypothetical protein
MFPTNFIVGTLQPLVATYHRSISLLQDILFLGCSVQSRAGAVYNDSESIFFAVDQRCPDLPRSVRAVATCETDELRSCKQ